VLSDDGAHVVLPLPQTIGLTEETGLSARCFPGGETSRQPNGQQAGDRLTGGIQDAAFVIDQRVLGGTCRMQRN
jgi:hypothetical protein